MEKENDDGDVNILLYKCNKDDYYLFVYSDKEEVIRLKEWNKNGGCFGKCEICNGPLIIDKIYNNKEEYLKLIDDLSKKWHCCIEVDRFRREFKELWQ